MFGYITIALLAVALCHAQPAYGSFAFPPFAKPSHGPPSKPGAIIEQEDHSQSRNFIECNHASLGSENIMSNRPGMDDDGGPNTLRALPYVDRRHVLQSAAYLSSSLPLVRPTEALANEQEPIRRNTVFEIDDPTTYSAVVYIPPSKKNDGNADKEVESFPLLVVLHGAGNNEHSALYEFTQAAAADSSTPPGDHTNLPPYLLSTHRAPSSLSENFVVVAPYVGRGKRSLYDDPRGKILSFVKWFNAWIETQTMEDGTSVSIDRRRVSLFGFSEGSTLAVELATTRQFNGVVLASYGFTGILPKMAVERLQGIPIWAFHSKGDRIYDIQCSNQLIESLIPYQGGLDVFDVGNIVKYTQLIPPQSNGGDDTKPDSGREHVRAALVASKSGDVFTWLQSLQ